MATIDAKGNFVGTGSIVPSAPAPTPPVIPVTQLTTPQTPLAIPTQPIQRDYSSIANASLESILAGFNTPTPQDSTIGDLQSQILKTLDQTSQKSARKQELESQSGLTAQKQQLQNVIKQLQGLSAEADTIQTYDPAKDPANAGRGITKAGIQPLYADQREALRQNAIKRLGLSATAQAYQGDIALAQSSIESALSAEFDPLEKRLDTLKQAYQFNKDALERTDRKKADMLNYALNERTRILAEQKNNKDAAYAMAIAARKNFPNDFAVERAVSEALSLEVDSPNYLRDVFDKIGRYQANPSEIQTSLLDQEYKQAQIRKIKADAAESEASVSAASRVSGIKAEYGSPQYYTDLFSASRGGKQLTGDQTTPLTKAAIVLNQVNELASQISSADTGPILGILRDNNPYDVKARLIQAQLRATVPNLARGVYGEVGVLTDTDIANYIQTLPNIKGTAGANKLILAMTLDTVKRSYEAYLETYANSGRDVSGFNRQYDSLSQRVEGIKHDIGYIPAGSDPYAALKSQLSPGEILVLRNGVPYAITSSEFNLLTDKFPPGSELPNFFLKR